MENNSDKNGEIDLRVLFYTVKKFLSGIVDYFNRLIRIVQKRWILIFVFLGLGAGAGIKLYLSTPPTYIASLTLASYVLKNDYCADIIHDLQLIVEDNTPKLLAERLNIDTNTAKTIKRIEYSNYKEKYANKDTVVLGQPFKIKLFVTTNTVFGTLQKAFVDYLENNDYAQKRKIVKQQNNIMMRQKLRGVMKELDSLKYIISTNLIPRGNESGFVFGQPLDPINTYREGIAYFQRDLNLHEESILGDNIEIINAFTPRNKPDNPVLWKAITKGLILGLFLALLTIFILERRKKSKSASQ